MHWLHYIQFQLFKIYFWTMLALLSVYVCLYASRITLRGDLRRSYIALGIGPELAVHNTPCIVSLDQLYFKNKLLVTAHYKIISD